MTVNGHDYSGHLGMGNAILKRLGKSFPSALGPQVKSFRETHAQFETAAAEADAVRNDRDAALIAIAHADETLDKSVLLLADALVAVGLGTPKNPFAKFSRRMPAQIVELFYDTEVKEVRALLAKVSKAKVSKTASREARQALTTIRATCARDAREVESALRALARPQMLLEKATADRDGLLLEWMKTLSRLKARAATAWDGDDAALRLLFATPGQTA